MLRFQQISGGGKTVRVGSEELKRAWRVYVLALGREASFLIESHMGRLGMF